MVTIFQKIHMLRYPATHQSYSILLSLITNASFIPTFLLDKNQVIKQFFIQTRKISFFFVQFIVLESTFMHEFGAKD